jgi:phosphoribosylaminoimidazole-succinocarboxamide synthase
MIDIEILQPEEFKELPLVVEGESKEVCYAGEGMVAIRLKPTIYSYTHNRNGVMPGSETLRLRAIQALLPAIREAGLKHSYQEVNNRWILSSLVLQPQLRDGPAPFRPPDLTDDEIACLPTAPPIEVIAKQRHTGTSKHRYFDFSNYPTRPGVAGPRYIGPESPYPNSIVRFDWRNPLHDLRGNRLADEVLAEDTAEWFIDTAKARTTAQVAFDSLSSFFHERQLDLWDICFFIAEDGERLFGEVSPDCMRVRALGGVALDKDVWRAGGSSDQVLEKWLRMVELIEGHQKVSC